MRIRVMEQTTQALGQKTRMIACPTALTIRQGRWIAEITDAQTCAPTMEKMSELGPEARANLARHLETADPELQEYITRMRKRSTS